MEDGRQRNSEALHHVDPAKPSQRAARAKHLGALKAAGNKIPPFRRKPEMNWEK